MKLIKKYTLFWVGEQTINDVEIPQLSYGRVTGPYYSRDYPKTIFDSEEEAIKYAFEKEPYGNFLVLPLYSFNNFPEI